jgi:hypothetical protein
MYKLTFPKALTLCEATLFIGASILGELRGPIKVALPPKKKTNKSNFGHTHELN